MTIDMEAALNALLGQIPAGRAATYGSLADALGDRSAMRWLGYWLLHHVHTQDCPCHRVVRVDGRPGNYIAGEESDKLQRLEQEGCQTRNDERLGRVVDLEQSGFSDFVADFPLRRLQAVQYDSAAQVVLKPLAEPPKWLAGVDLSYLDESHAVAAYALIDPKTGELAWSKLVLGEARFPYITGYLAFRELPLLRTLIQAVQAEGRLADVVLVDGNGMLHDRHAGVASHLGTATGAATIGVAKKLLCGEVSLENQQVGEPRWITLDGQPIGAALLPRAGSKRIFVSPGHNIDLADSVRVVSSMLGGRRLPEPTFWADRLSRDEVRRLKGEAAAD